MERNLSRRRGARCSGYCRSKYRWTSVERFARFLLGFFSKEKKLDFHVSLFLYCSHDGGRCCRRLLGPDLRAALFLALGSLIEMGDMREQKENFAMRTEYCGWGPDAYQDIYAGKRDHSKNLLAERALCKGCNVK